MLLGRFEPLYPEFLDSKSRNPQFVDLPSVQLGSTEGKMADRQLTYRQYSKRHGSERHRSKRQGSQTNCPTLTACVAVSRPAAAGTDSPGRLTALFLHSLIVHPVPTRPEFTAETRRIAVNLGDIFQQHCPGVREMEANLPIFMGTTSV
jgi:hypothetical protein